MLVILLSKKYQSVIYVKEKEVKRYLRLGYRILGLKSKEI